MNEGKNILGVALKVRRVLLLGSGENSGREPARGWRTPRNGLLLSLEVATLLYSLYDNSKGRILTICALYVCVY